MQKSRNAEMQEWKQNQIKKIMRKIPIYNKYKPNIKSYYETNKYLYINLLN